MVSRGSDQVSITSKFEAREDAGKIMIVNNLCHHLVNYSVSCDT